MNRKGFTLMELIVVIVILGILTLLAAPIFANHIHQAELTRVKNDVSVVESILSKHMLDYGLLEGYELYEGLEEAVADDKVYSAKPIDLDDNFYNITDSELTDTTNMGGLFLATDDAQVVYIYGDGENIVADKGGGSQTGPNGEDVIKTASDLGKIKDNLDGDFILMSDIDLSGIDWDPIGDTSNPFKGTIDGNGFIIRNLTINKPNESLVGLFGYIERAELKNIKIEDAKITGRSNVGMLVGWNKSGNIYDSYAKGDVIYTSGNTGGLVGRNSHNAVISGSHSSGTIASSRTDVGSFIGGLVSVNEHNSFITNSYSTSTVSGLYNIGGLVALNRWESEINLSYATGNITGYTSGGGHMGGLVAQMFEGKIINSYSTGNVKGSDVNLGGLVGIITDDTGINAKTSKVQSSYSTGTVISSNTSKTGSFIGGLVGRSIPGARVITTSYWDKDAYGPKASSNLGLSRTSSQMKTQANYSGWDFVNIWDISPSLYPILKDIN